MHRPTLYLWTWLRCVDLCPLPCYPPLLLCVPWARIFHLHPLFSCIALQTHMSEFMVMSQPNGVYYLLTLSNPYLHRDMPMNNHDGRPWHFCSRRYHFGGNDCAVAHMQAILKVPFSARMCPILRVTFCGKFFMPLTWVPFLLRYCDVTISMSRSCPDPCHVLRSRKGIHGELNSGEGIRRRLEWTNMVGRFGSSENIDARRHHLFDHVIEYFILFLL